VYSIELDAAADTPAFQLVAYAEVTDNRGETHAGNQSIYLSIHPG
jgi:hypothetical protein